jgi:HKD family nuclease
MFVQNQISHLPSHYEVISEELENADEVLLIVSYVRNNGVDAIIDKIKDKPLKLLCSFDMGITQLDGIKRFGTILVKDIKIKLMEKW